MAEKITNGAFTTNLTGWYNYGAYDFTPEAGMAGAESGEDSTGHQCRLRQYFSITGAATSAVVSAWIAWDLYHESAGDGEAIFYLYLRKPDSTLVQLATHTEEAAGADNNGSTDLAASLNILAHLDQVGTYALELWAVPTSAWYVPIDEPVYTHSYAYFDDISLLVGERQYKTIVEGLGGGELTNLISGLAPAVEVAGLGESISHHGGYQPGVDPKMEGTSRDKAGLHEFLHADVEGNTLDGAGLAESLERTYNYRKHDLPDMPNVAGLDESLKAKWKVGNVTHERDVLAEEDIWEDISPVATDWETV